jgi:hypothetical protein
LRKPRYRRFSALCDIRAPRTPASLWAARKLLQSKMSRDRSRRCSGMSTSRSEDCRAVELQAQGGTRASKQSGIFRPAFLVSH